MDKAAANGHWEVVKWLHEKRSEGCTMAALDGTASNGHLDVVKWLFANRSEGCTINAIENALKTVTYALPVALSTFLPNWRKSIFRHYHLGVSPATQ
ncbi:hypothetical protein JG688_00014782 [Phytophthora aleatoria]|uniref:Ankyrin repeat-containing domain n=1 Tax=Phytophthora aleatoria TaxID=2496075 RepID=A0A8J5IBD3_9STRA|nr:hypothetical protein JG688_00014782 [Phytophthora aleatoria]